MCPSMPLKKVGCLGNNSSCLHSSLLTIEVSSCYSFISFLLYSFIYKWTAFIEQLSRLANHSNQLYTASSIHSTTHASTAFCIHTVSSNATMQTVFHHLTTITNKHGKGNMEFSTLSMDTLTWTCKLQGH